MRQRSTLLGRLPFSGIPLCWWLLWAALHEFSQRQFRLRITPRGLTEKEVENELVKVRD